MEMRGKPLRLATAMATVHSSIALFFPSPFHRNDRISALPQTLPLQRTRDQGGPEALTRTIPLGGYKYNLAAASSLESRLDARHGRAHCIWTQIKFSLWRFIKHFFNRNLPRSKPPPRLPDNAIEMLQCAWKFICRLFLESVCAATVFTLASSVLFASIKRKFVITNVVRWLSLSAAIRMCILQSIIASMASFASEDCYFEGSYCVLSGDGTIPVKIRKNIGYGSCLFQSIAASVLTNETESIPHPSHSEVKKYSSVLRDLAVTTLANGIKTNAQMVLQPNVTISASSLVNEAAEQYGMAENDYLSCMRKESVWGGGPEIVAISNSLNRQIVLLQRVDLGFSQNTTLLEVSARLGPQISTRPIYILSTNRKFPKYYGKATNNHFLAVIPKLPY